MVPAPHSGSQEHPSRGSSVRVAGWLAGASACLRAVGVPVPGGGQQGPLPAWPSLCLCRSPETCTLSVCPGPVVLSVCVRVCVSWCCGPCVSVHVWLCYGPSESAPPLCSSGGLRPSLCWCCALATPEGRALRRSSTNKLVSHCVFQPLRWVLGRGDRVRHLSTNRFMQSKQPPTGPHPFPSSTLSTLEYTFR